jgi:citronellol/citronellal dehydrogenase
VAYSSILRRIAIRARRSSSPAADRLDLVVGEIEEDGGSAEALDFDIRDEEAVKAAIAAIDEKHGRIHGLVNNAGGQFPAPMESISKKGFEAVVATNLTGGFLMMREVYRHCMRDQGGAIVNIAADFWRGHAGNGAFGRRARRHVEPYPDRSL